jgi:hypothetical protein
MRTTARRHRNSRGEFVPVAEDQVATVENQVVANADEQRQIVSPVENRTNFGTLVTLKRWKIAVTPNRAQVFLWSFLMITKFLSMLSIASFWFCVIMCIKTFPAWNGPTHIFQGYMRRHEIIQAGNQVDDGDRLWGDIFPGMEILHAYTLKLALTETGHNMALVIYEYAIPLMIGNPLVWASLMVLAFFNYHFISFIHGCLQQANRATKTIARRRSS